ncbi:MAG: hypothetical protein ACI9SK_000629 [Zhongshania sp.]|jgi:hypothetical protein
MASFPAAGALLGVIAGELAVESLYGFGAELVIQLVSLDILLLQSRN